MHISARSDYAVQAMLAIAWHHGGPVKTAELARMQNIPVSYLPSVLADLRRARLLSGRTGIDGGYSLTRPVTEISVGDVMRAVEGTLATIRGRPPKSLSYSGAAAKLPAFWHTLHTATNSLLDNTMLSDLMDG